MLKPVMLCDGVRLRFTCSVEDGKIIIEDVELADKDAVMEDEDYLHDLQYGYDCEHDGKWHPVKLAPLGDLDRVVTKRLGEVTVFEPEYKETI